MKYFKKFVSAICNIYTAVACVLIAFVIALLFVQVVSRYLIGSSITWAEELARYMFVWSTLLGSTVALRKGLHPTINIIENMLREKSRSILQIVIYPTIILLSLIMIFKGIEVVRVASSSLSPLLRMNVSYLYLSLVFGGIGLFVQSLEIFLNNVFKLSGREVSD